MCDKCKCHGSTDESSGPQPFVLAEKVQYAPDSIVSSALADTEVGTLTVFSFAAGQRLSTHSAPFDAIVQIVDGEAKITVGDAPHHVQTGEMLIMPANVPHALEAEVPFKMLLTMFKA